MSGCFSLQSSSSLRPSLFPRSYSSSSSQPSVPVGLVQSQSVLGCETCSSRSADLRTKKTLSWAEDETRVPSEETLRQTGSWDEASNTHLTSDMFHPSDNFWLSEAVWNVERDTVTIISSVFKRLALSCCSQFSLRQSAVHRQQDEVILTCVTASLTRSRSSSQPWTAADCKINP